MNTTSTTTDTVRISETASDTRVDLICRTKPDVERIEVSVNRIGAACQIDVVVSGVDTEPVATMFVGKDELRAFALGLLAAVDRT